MKQFTLKISAILVFLAFGIASIAQVPDAITIEPEDATAFDEITLTLDVSLTCPDSALFMADSVMMHSGVKIGEDTWQNVVAFDGMGADGTYPKLVKIGGGSSMPMAITIEPAGATAWEEITLTLDASKSCPDSALFMADSVMMHSGLTIDGANWQNVIAFDAMGADGTQPKLMSLGDYKWSITYTPALFYGLTPGTEATQICCVFNAGDWAAGEGKDFDETGGCVDFFVPLGPQEESYLWQITFTPSEFYGFDETTVVQEINAVFNAGDWALGEGKDFDTEGGCTDFLIPLFYTNVANNPDVTFRMYPNPAQSVLNLEKLDGASKVEIFNVVGKLVQTVEVYENQTTLEINELNSGIYFVNVHFVDNVQSTKFIKK